MKLLKTIAISALLITGSAVAQLDLPKEVQADLKQQEIIKALKSQNFKGADDLFKQYEALGVTMPPPLLFFKAQTKFQLGDFVASKATLEAYLKSAKRGSDSYNKALSMYTSVTPKAQAQQAEIDAKKQRRLAEKQAREKNLIDQALTDLPNQMVQIPLGEFVMGSENGHDDETPLRTIKVDKPFKMGKYEVTFALWDKCITEGGCNHKPDDEGWGRGNRPVINVSWNDIQQQFLPWLNRVSNGAYRLPTEAEWEYAARAGTTTAYSWGDAQPNCQAARFDGGSSSNCNYTNADGSYQGTVNVGTYSANKFGLYDVHGNVWEWVQDCYYKNYKRAPKDQRERVKKKQCDGSRVLRGGSWYNIAYYIRSAYRYGNSPSSRHLYNGFRLAQDN